MKNISSFSQWSKESLCLAHAKTFAFVVVCFVGFFMPTVGQAQVWIEDLVIRPVGTETYPTKSTQVLPSTSRESLQIGDIYPQASPELRYGSSEAKVEVEVRSFQGELVWQKRGISEEEVSRSMPSLGDGIYIIIVKSAEGINHKTIAIHSD